MFNLISLISTPEPRFSLESQEAARERFVAYN